MPPSKAGAIAYCTAFQPKASSNAPEPKEPTGNEAENQEVVQALYLGLLGKRVRGAEQTRRADVREVPTDAEGDKREIEVLQLHACQRDRCAHAEQQSTPTAMTGKCAENRTMIENPD